MFGFFKKHCVVCGVEVGKKTFKRFGKRFCSEEHQKHFVNEVEKQRKRSSKASCCCG